MLETNSECSDGDHSVGCPDFLIRALAIDKCGGEAFTTDKGLLFERRQFYLGQVCKFYAFKSVQDLAFQNWVDHLELPFYGVLSFVPNRV